MNKRIIWTTAILVMVATAWSVAQDTPGLAGPLSALVLATNSSGKAIAATLTNHVTWVGVSTAPTAKVIPDCTDTGGNHLNFTQSTDAFSCGTSGGLSWGNPGQTMLWGYPGYSNSGGGMSPAGFGTAGNAGVAASFTVSGVLKFSTFIESLVVAGTSGQAMMLTVYAYDGSSILCASSVLTGAGKIDTTGRQTMTVASGSAASGGFCTLSAGGYKIVGTADNTTVKILSYYGDAGSGAFFGTAAGGGAALTTIELGYASAASTLSGASLTPVANISGLSFKNDQGVNNSWPVIAVK